MAHALHQLTGVRPGRQGSGGGRVAQVVEAQPFNPSGLRGGQPPAAEVRPAYVAALGGREHQRIRAGLGELGQVLGQGDRSEGRPPSVQAAQTSSATCAAVRGALPLARRLSVHSGRQKKKAKSYALLATPNL
jgi:hypothetical protein